MTTIFRVFILFILSSILVAPHSFAMIGEKGQALQFNYEVIELNGKVFWNLQNENEMIQVRDTEKSNEPLIQYKELIEHANDHLLPLFLYSCFTLFVIAFAVFFVLTKPKRLKHPLFISCIILAFLFGLKIYSFYDTLLHAEANLRYYYLLLEKINSPH